MISVIVPSRDRPNELLTALNSFELAKHGIEALVWLDDDDPQLDKYKEFFDSNRNVRLFIKKRVGYLGCAEMLYFLCLQAKYDWFFGFSDDAYMDNPEWFNIFKNFVSEFEPTNQPVVLNIWGQGDPKRNLFAIVSRKFIDILGHYSLMWGSDNYVNWVALGANIVYNLNGIKPKHRKYGGENPLRDATFEQVENDRYHMKRHRQDPQESPYKQMIEEDIAKIVSYNMSTSRRQN